ncbi:unnamed protein product [Mytilus edulis]|uniref:Uncharacterized protein n=1 Tax=Mytilus edulis TaxID=6550 RepID=A0A8S3RD91_MYTED|nr:unnamed protein product [Mytilus edulis]
MKRDYQGHDNKNSRITAEDKLPSDEVRPSQGNVKPNHKQSSAEDKFPSDEVRPRHGNLQINHKHSSDVVTGASMIIKATSLGLTLGSALSGGCMYFPSICTNKDEIERLDGKIKTMTRKYETDYKRSKMMYYTLKTATTDNAYIDYYINQTMQAVQKLQEIESDLTIFLQVKLPELSRMTKNETYENILNMLLVLLNTDFLTLSKCYLNIEIWLL